MTYMGAYIHTHIYTHMRTYVNALLPQAPLLAYTRTQHTSQAYLSIQNKHLVTKKILVGRKKSLIVRGKNSQHRKIYLIGRATYSCFQVFLNIVASSSELSDPSVADMVDISAGDLVSYLCEQVDTPGRYVRMHVRA